jgi:hypothetical protein
LRVGIGICTGGTCDGRGSNLYTLGWGKEMPKTNPARGTKNPYKSKNLNQTEVSPPENSAPGLTPIVSNKPKKVPPR